MDTISYKIGNKAFILDKNKANEAFKAKKVINGGNIPYFNILPLKYNWAYEMYKKMKANHWEPEDIQMQKDCEQWKSSDISEIERWIIKMGIGYFSAAEGLVGDNILHVIRNLVTAPELKLALGRHAHEENIHADSLVYILSSLGINPHECESMLLSIKSIQEKNNFILNITNEMRKDIDLNKIEHKQSFAKNIFVFGQCMEGMQFYGLFGMILALYRQNKFPGIGQMFRYTLRDESNHIELLRKILIELVKENPEIWTNDFKNDLCLLMKEAVRLEKRFIEDCLPINTIGLNLNDFISYIDYIADRRLEGLSLPLLNNNLTKNPFPWLAELMDIKKEQNFFEGRVTEYQKSSSLEVSSDDEL